MQDWTEGYTAEIGYTFGYYSELNPARLPFAFHNAGLHAPQIKSACELGFGQGISTNIHAAASDIEWWGTDFNPSQAAFAQDLSAKSGANAQLFDQAFEQFCMRDDLPEFDFIGLHGIWSWISDQNRACIVDFIRRKLRVGGVVYVSYNTLPGWSSFAPMRHLMTEHVAAFGNRGQGTVSRINEAIEFAEKLIKTNPLYSKAMPVTASKLDAMKNHDRHYLAHEYFNQDWHPMYFADFAKWMGDAKLEFACSAHYVDALDKLSFTAEQNALLSEISDPTLKQMTRDFICNQQFRRDYWVKGARPMTTYEQTKALREQAIVLTSPKEKVKLNIAGGVNQINLREEIATPIIELLATHEPITLGQLLDQLEDKGINWVQIVQVSLLLVGANFAQPVADGPSTDTILAKAKALNAELTEKAKSNTQIGYVASTVTGGGFALSRFDKMFLKAQSDGHTTVQALAEYVWDILNAQGQKLLKDGEAIAEPADNIKRLVELAEVYLADTQPRLAKWGISLA